MKNIIFDIETGPNDLIYWQHILDEAKENGKKKTPAKNLKDPDKIKAAWEAIEKENNDEIERIIERAPLSAMTGKILCIGFYDGSQYVYIDHDSEKQIIKSFWDYCLDHDAVLVGHNIRSFDLPFIARRGYIWGVTPRMGYLERYSKRVIDTMELWAGGEFNHKASLNDIAKAMQVGEKTGSGDMFHKWWNGGEKDKAIEYLRTDLELTYHVAQRMGVRTNELF